MPLRRAAELVAVGGFVYWAILGFPGVALRQDVDSIVTGSIVRAPPAAPAGPSYLVVDGAATEALAEGAFQSPGSQPLAQPIQAQSDAPPPAVLVPRAPPPPATPVARVSSGKVDESALRYFARQGDKQRLDAEIRRLKILYPGWEPPADPLAGLQPADPQIEQLWQLYTAGRYAELRSLIAERTASDPGWLPPAALTDLLAQAESRKRIANASDARQWGTVINVAAQTPGLLTCQDVDVLWRVAEAFAQSKRLQRARDTYLYLVGTCDNPQERLATLQKALAFLPDDDIVAMLQYEREGELEPIRDELARRRIGKVAQQPDVIAAPEDLERVDKLARSEPGPGDPLLLGWYYYRHNEPAKALDWFVMSRSREDSAKAAEGYTLTLSALNRDAEAETVGYDWHDKSADNLKAYLDSVVKLLAIDPPLKITRPVLERIATVVSANKKPEAGEQLGWYAYNIGQPKTASVWFRTVLKWKPDYEPAAFGLAVSLLRLKDRGGANVVIREWRDKSERIADLARPVKASLRGSERVVVDLGDDQDVYDPELDAGTAVDDGDYFVEEPVRPVRSTSRRTGSAGGACNSGVPTASLSPDAAVPRGWCLMDLNRPVEAAQAFEMGLRSSNAKTREDAAYGASLANLRNGVTDKAAVAAAAAPQSYQRQIELAASLLAQQASAAYTDGRYAETILALDERTRYAPEQTDLMVMRGWSYFRLNRIADARRIFQAVAGTGLPDGVRGLAEVQALGQR